MDVSWEYIRLTAFQSTQSSMLYTQFSPLYALNKTQASCSNLLSVRKSIRVGVCNYLIWATESNCIHAGCTQMYSSVCTKKKNPSFTCKALLNGGLTQQLCIYIFVWHCKCSPENNVRRSQVAAKVICCFCAFSLKFKITCGLCGGCTPPHVRVGFLRESQSCIWGELDFLHP